MRESDKEGSDSDDDNDDEGTDDRIYTSFATEATDRSDRPTGRKRKAPERTAGGGSRGWKKVTR